MIQRVSPNAIVLALVAALTAVASCATPAAAPDVADVTAAADAPRVPTYWRDVAPLVNARCTGCHVAGGIGPLALDTYATARAAAPAMAAETAARRMPPWLPRADGCRALRDSPALNADDVATLARWSAAGAPEGDPADYVAPTPPTDTLPPAGDVTVQPDEDYAPTVQTGTDDYHCFIMDPHLTATRDIVGVRVEPGNAAIVHHVVLFEVRESALAQLQALDDATPGPGYTCFGSVGIEPNFRLAPAGSSDLADFDSQFVFGWAPGSGPTRMPPTTGVRLHAGSRLVMQVHYNLASVATRGMRDRSRVDLYFSPTGVPSQGIWIPVAQTSFTVPPGASPSDPEATVRGTLRALGPLRVFGTGPHMHLRGRSIRVDLAHADGTSECLVDIPTWDFHWQRSYWFQSPLRTQAGAMADIFRLACVYDNTAANQPVIDGVQQPPRTLHWGDSTLDEMCINFIYMAL